DIHVAVFFDLDMRPVLFHTLEAAGLDQLENVLFLVLRDREEIRLEMFLPLRLEELEHLVVKPREVVRRDHARLRSTCRQLPGPVISVESENGEPSASAALVRLVWSQNCGAGAPTSFATWCHAVQRLTVNTISSAPTAMS